MACSSVVEKDGTVFVLLSCGSEGLLARSHHGLVRLRIGFIPRSSSPKSARFRFVCALGTKCDRRGAVWGQNLSLRARISAKTAASGASGRPSNAFIWGRLARRKGLVANSPERREGTVARFSARAGVTRAMRGFGAVFSWPERIGVGGGGAASFDRLCHIGAGVPSNRRPQPPAIRLSAAKAQRLSGKWKAMLPRAW